MYRHSPVILILKTALERFRLFLREMHQDAKRKILSIMHPVLDLPSTRSGTTIALDGFVERSSDGALLWGCQFWFSSCAGHGRLGLTHRLRGCVSVRQ